MKQSGIFSSIGKITYCRFAGGFAVLYCFALALETGTEILQGLAEILQAVGFGRGG